MGLRIKPTTTLDKASLIHDIEYLKDDQFKADNNMWINIVKENPLLIPIANATRAAFLVKDVIGYKTEQDLESYKYLKDIVERDYELGNMTFYD